MVRLLTCLLLVSMVTLFMSGSASAQPPPAPVDTAKIEHESHYVEVVFTGFGIIEEGTWVRYKPEYTASRVDVRWRLKTNNPNPPGGFQHAQPIADPENPLKGTYSTSALLVARGRAPQTFTFGERRLILLKSGGYQQFMVTEPFKYDVTIP